MGKYAMFELRKSAMQNFLRGNLRFKAFGNVDVRIIHQHDNEYGVTIYDPIACHRCEILRILDGATPCFA